MPPPSWTHASNAPSVLVSATHALEQSKDHDVVIFRSELSALTEAAQTLLARYTYEVDLVKDAEGKVSAQSSSFENVRARLDELHAAAAAADEDASKLRSDAAVRRERAAKAERAVADATARVAVLEARVAEGSGWTGDQEAARAAAERERDMAAASVERARHVLGTARDEERAAEARLAATMASRAEADAGVANATAAADAIRARVTAAHRRQESRARDTEATRTALGIANQTLTAKTAEAEAAAAAASRAGAALRRDQQALADAARDAERAAVRIRSLGGDTDAAIARAQGLLRDVEEAEGEVERVTQEALRSRAAAEKTQKLIALANAKGAEAAAAAATANEELQKLKDRVRAEEDAVERANSAAAAARSRAEAAEREKDALQKGLARAGDKAKAAKAAAAYQTAALRSLEAEIAGIVAHTQRVQNDAAAVKASRDALAADADAITAAYITADEKCRSAAAELSSLETALAAQKSTVHDLSQELSVANKARASAQREAIANAEKLEAAKAEYSNLSTQLRQVRAVVMQQDSAIVASHLQLQQLENETNANASAALSMTEATGRGEALLNAAKTEHERLRILHTEASTELARAAAARRDAESRRVTLTDQHAARLATLRGLVDKSSAQRSALNAGARAFDDLAAQKKALLATAAELKGELAALSGGSDDADIVTRECTRLESELDDLRVKASVLRSQVSAPLNLHRWRGLSSRDPARWAAISRIHALQKKMLEVRDEGAAAAVAADEESKKIDKLQRLLERAPSVSADAADAAAALAAELKAKSSQLKAVEAEREAAAARVSDAQFALRSVTESIEALNAAYVKTTLAQTKSRRNTVHAAGGALLGAAARSATGLGGVGGVGSTARAMEDADAAIARWESKSASDRKRPEGKD